MDHETDRHPAGRRRKPGEPDQGGGTGAVAGRASTPVPQTGMTQCYATSLISAWHFLHERFCGYCGLPAGVFGRQKENARDAGEDGLTTSLKAKQFVRLFCSKTSHPVLCLAATSTVNDSFNPYL